MQRKRRRGDAEHDVETVLDKLYITPPPDFVSRREELASAAKAAGRVDDARRIHAARRPTLAAWAGNLLLRSRPEESRRFLELGRALREAYQTLDAGGVKELSERRRSVVAALSQQAARLAREAGHRLSDAAQRDVESTLRAVLADQEAADQWAAGRLESALSPPSTFPSGMAPAVGAPTKPPGPTTTPQSSTPQSSRSREKDELADRRRQRQAELTRAKREAETAAERLRGRQAAQADADTRLQHARDRHHRAREQVSAAERQERKAREELRQAEKEQQEAEERHQAAAGALARAEQSAHEAAQKVERLAAPGT